MCLDCQYIRDSILVSIFPKFDRFYTSWQGNVLSTQFCHCHTRTFYIGPSDLAIRHREAEILVGRNLVVEYQNTNLSTLP